MARKGLSLRQQILTEQEPETPWHLHTMSRVSFAVWNTEKVEPGFTDLNKNGAESACAESASKGVD